MLNHHVASKKSYTKNIKLEPLKGSVGAYNASFRLGIYEEVCLHMKSGRGKYTLESCTIDALKCSSRKEFSTLFSGSYEASNRNGWMDNICSHMKSRFTFWTKDMCATEALKYSSRSQFWREGVNAYNSANRYGWIDEICSHMKDISGGVGSYTIKAAERNRIEWLNNKCEVYLVRLSGNGETFYKVGIATNGIIHRFPKSKRGGYSIEIVDSINTNWYDATYIEKRNLNRFEPYSPKVKISGFKECFQSTEGDLKLSV